MICSCFMIVYPVFNRNRKVQIVLRKSQDGVHRFADIYVINRQQHEEYVPQDGESSMERFMAIRFVYGIESYLFRKEKERNVRRKSALPMCMSVRMEMRCSKTSAANDGSFYSLIKLIQKGNWRVNYFWLEIRKNVLIKSGAKWYIRLYHKLLFYY